MSVLAAMCFPRLLVAALGAWLGGCALAPAKDPVVLYKVSIVPTGDPALDQALADASRLVTLAERPRRSLRLSGAYSSDEGLNAAASWLHRNL